MSGYTNMISDIDVITDNPERHSSAVLRRAMHDARTVYQYGNKPKEWYDQVVRICNNELSARGEQTE